MTRFQKILLGILAAAALGAGFSLGRILNLSPPAEVASGPSDNQETLIGQPRPAFTLPDLENRPRSIAEWDGRPLLINFWATWCAPCRKEIPVFIDARKRYASQGLEIIGIAIDLPDMVNDYAEEMNIDYPLLYGEENAMDVNSRYGNRTGALPYTVLVDARGIIRAIHATGALDEAELETLLEDLLRSNAEIAPN
ncbi:MAG TPA: TlpA disulfide reductase family protein [Gammaproteobacteria bacterium]